MSDSSTRRANPLRSRAALLTAGIVLAFLAGIAAREIASIRAPVPEIPGFLWPNPKQVTEFELTDHRGAPFDRSRLTGRWSLLFFGYTHCPDVCPLTLAAMKNVHDALEEAGEKVDDLQTVFVSVDPERDTLEHLGPYVTHFDPDFIGVTGDEAALQKLTRQLGVLFIRQEPDASGVYLVDHTASVLVIDPHHRLVGVLGAPHEPAEVAERLTQMRAVVEG